MLASFRPLSFVAGEALKCLDKSLPTYIVGRPGNSRTEQPQPKPGQCAPGRHSIISEPPWRVSSSEKQVRAGTDLGSTVAADLLRSPNVRGLLVEASPSNFKQLQQNLQSSGLSKRHTAVNAAVCTASKEMTFCSVTEDFADKYPDAPHYAQSEINSFNRQHVLAVLGFAMGQDRSQAKRFVIETPVSCYNPRKLLRSSDLKPASIDVLFVDAEGMDAEIVLAFLSIPTFRPRAIVAEVAVAVSGFSKRLNTTLLDAGYITEMGDSRNLFAWK